MKNLKTFKTLAAAPLALAVAFAVGVPAQAQPMGRHDNHNQGWQNQGQRNQAQAWRLTPARNAEIRQDINGLRNAIDRAAARRTISPREASGLRNQARSIQQLYGQYARNGLSRDEVRNLQTRVNNVRVALRMERRDWDGRRG